MYEHEFIKSAIANAAIRTGFLRSGKQFSAAIRKAQTNTKGWIPTIQSNRYLNTPMAERLAAFKRQKEIMKRMGMSEEEIAFNAAHQTFKGWSSAGTNHLNKDAVKEYLNKYSKEFVKHTPEYRKATKAEEIAKRITNKYFNAIPDDVASGGVLAAYKVNKPFGTTHHLADPKLSANANELARQNQQLRHVANPNPDKGWKQWRSDTHGVSVPGRKWTPEQKNLLLTSSNLGGTPYYETVLNGGDVQLKRLFVNGSDKATREFFGLTRNKSKIPVSKLQSNNQGIVYKGSDLTNGAPAIIRPNTNQPLWFAPGVNTSSGYANLKYVQEISPEQFATSILKSRKGLDELYRIKKHYMKLDNALRNYGEALSRREPFLNSVNSFYNSLI